MSWNLSKIRSQIENLRDATQKQADKLADQVAQTVTEWTGRETTGDEVKTAVALTAVVTAGMALAAQQQQALQNPTATAQHGSRNFFPTLQPQLDPTAQWEQDDLDYDQQLHDQLRDHNDYVDHMNDVASDHISYNDSLDF